MISSIQAQTRKDVLQASPEGSQPSSTEQMLLKTTKRHYKKTVWTLLSLPSAPSLPLKLVRDVIASCVQQLLRNRLCNALVSLQQNQGIIGFSKGLSVFWLTTEGQTTSLNRTKWSNKGCHTSVYSTSCLGTKGSGICTGCPSKGCYFC